MRRRCRVSAATIPCDDCAGALADHSPGCPAVEVIDRQADDDRQFFERFPDVDTRRRKPHISELREVFAASGTPLPPPPDGKRWHAGGYVLVRRTAAPGVRIRLYGNAYVLLDPDKPVDAVWHLYRPE